MVPQSVAQALQCAKLKLLHRAFASSDVFGDVADTLSFHKTHADDFRLILRQLVHHAEDLRALLDLLQIGVILGFQIEGLFAGVALRAIYHRIRGDPVEPCGERDAAPLKSI